MTVCEFRHSTSRLEAVKMPKYLAQRVKPAYVPPLFPSASGPAPKPAPATAPAAAAAAAVAADPDPKPDVIHPPPPPQQAAPSKDTSGDTADAVSVSPILRGGSRESSPASSQSSRAT